MRFISIVTVLVAIFAFSGCSRPDVIPLQNKGKVPELVLQFGHTGAVTTLAYSPDGKTLASAATDNTIRFWQAQSGEAKSSMSGQYANVQSLEYSTDSNYLVARSGDNEMNWGGEVIVWETSTHKTIRVWPARRQDDSRNGILASAIAPNSKTIALANWVRDKEQGDTGKSQITLWDIASGKQVSAIATIGRRTRGLAFSHDGKSLAAVTENGSTLLYEIATRKLKRTFSRQVAPGTRARDNGLFSVAFSLDDKNLAAMGIASAEMVAATIVWLWDIKSGKIKNTFAGAGIGQQFAFSRDGKTLVSAGSMLGASAVIFWDVATGKDKRTFYGAAGMPVPIALAPDGKTVAVGNSKQSSLDNLDAEAWKTVDGDIQLQDAATGRVLHTLRGHTQIPVEAVAFSPDGKRFASFSHDEQAISKSKPPNVRLWNAQTGRLQTSFQGQPVLAFSADGKIIATGQEVPHVRRDLGRKRIEPYWDQYTGSMKGDIEPDTDGVVALRDAATGKLLRRLSSAPYVVPYGIAFSPDGKTLATQSFDENWSKLQLWDFNSGKVLRTLKTHSGESGGTPIAFSPDGRLIANGWQITGKPESAAVEIWDVFSGKQKLALKTGTLPADTEPERISSIAFSPNGKILIGRTLSFLLFWDAVTGARLRLIPTEAFRNAGEASDTILRLQGTAPLAIAPDGKIIATETDESNIKLWDVQSGKMLRELKGHESGVLTLSFSPDSKKLLSGSNDGSAKVWNAENGELILTTIVIGVAQSKAGTTTDWIAYTPDGFYDGSAGAEKFIRWRVGDELLPAAKFTTEKHRPGLITQVLAAPR